MKITEEEKLQRKQLIISTAFELFCKKGIEKVTMSEIAKKAGVGETTIYRYFKNKPLLVHKTLNMLWREVGSGIERSVRQTKDYDNMTGREQIRTQINCIKELYEENSDYVLFSYESKLYFLRHSVIITQAEYDSLMEAIKKPCIEAFEKGKSDGSIPVNINSEDLFYVIWGAIRGYIVKVVIYRSFFEDANIWARRYPELERGILCALKNGWEYTE